MDCKCGKKAVITRKYEGRAFCESCLKIAVEKRFLKTIKGNISKDDKIAVAVSGGKDSSVLLYLMKKTMKNEMFAIAVDEGINGYRDISLEYAEKLADKLKIPFHTVSLGRIFKNLDEISGKKCTYCGVFRRYLLNKKARELGATKLATGHNMDDEAQSIMMNFFRGDISRFQRLGSAAKGRNLIQRIKPLRDIPEREVTAYAVVSGIEFYGGECPHSFDNVRRDVQTMLNNIEAGMPGTKLQIIRFYEKLKLRSENKSFKECSECGEPSSQEKCRACGLMESILK